MHLLLDNHLFGVIISIIMFAIIHHLYHHQSSSIKQHRYYDSDLTIFTHEIIYHYDSDDVNDVNADNDDTDVVGGDDDADENNLNSDNICEYKISSDDKVNSNYSLYDNNDRSDKAIQGDTITTAKLFLHKL